MSIKSSAPSGGRAPFRCLDTVADRDRLTDETGRRNAFSVSANEKRYRAGDSNDKRVRRTRRRRSIRLIGDAYFVRDRDGKRVGPGSDKRIINPSPAKTPVGEYLITSIKLSSAGGHLRKLTGDILWNTSRALYLHLSLLYDPRVAAVSARNFRRRFQYSLLTSYRVVIIASNRRYYTDACVLFRGREVR